jgi:hypothetical protein
VVDAVAIAQKHAQNVILAVLGGGSEVVIEVAAKRGEPGDRPAHALLEGLDRVQRRPGDQDQRCVASAQMGQVADVVDQE